MTPGNFGTDNSFMLADNNVQRDIEEEYKDLEELRKVLASQRSRLDNLYWIKDATGNRIKFNMNWAQKNIYLGLWYFTNVLKARQLGVTTFSCIFGLDLCMFNSNTQALIVAHNKDDAEEFFHQKVKYAYDNLPEPLRLARPVDTKRTNRLRFDNGSSIRVATSGRSGTFQFIHISEFGKICAKYPEKAKEIVSGTLNAIHPGQIVIIESTAEGREGYFYDYCEIGQKNEQSGAKLTALDPKFFFFPWWKNTLNVLDPEGVNLYAHNVKYFEELEVKHGINLTAHQKAWYAKKLAQMGQDLMYQEHPSIPEEAFYAAIEGAYFKEQMKKLRRERRICSVPYNPAYLVDTWWDLGYNDINAIWFTQNVGRELHVIDYYENSGEGLLHYINYLNDLKEDKEYRYGLHTAPHDILVHEYTSGKTRKAFARESGLNFKVCSRTSKDSQIEASRRMLGIVLIDEIECDRGLKCLESYRKEWDEKKGTYKNKPYHDWASNGADAFHVLSIAHKWAANAAQLAGLMEARSARHGEKKNPKGWT
jgi:hypothetical protein